ncbi:MAG: DUF1932 domain-containing protein [Pseudomonadota bacterium]
MDTNPPAIGVLHPGQMGISVAHALIEGGNRVCWASDGRSQGTKDRAAKYALHDSQSLEQLCNNCNVVFSICPPAEALNLARSVIANGFSGIYVDGNAIAPSSTREIASELAKANINYVDGGIIGPPAWRAGTTRLYLSGTRASTVCALFDGSVMDTVNLGEGIDTASAMKMAYAAWTKGSAALLLNVFALAKSHNLHPALLEEWGLSQPGLESKLDNAALGNAPKGWRFVGEMNQIATTLSDAGLHPGAFDAAASVYEALAPFKDAESQTITTDAVIDAIVKARR